VGGETTLAAIMVATATFEHRAIDGAVAAQFMAAPCDQIEVPLKQIA